MLSDTLMRDLATEPPDYSGRGRRPNRPWHSVAIWSQALDEKAWRRIDVRDGSQGLLVVDIVKQRVVSRTHRRQRSVEYAQQRAASFARGLSIAVLCATQRLDQFEVPPRHFIERHRARG